VAGKRVAVLDPDGRFGTVDEADVGKLPDGARVLSAQEVKSRELDEQYAKAPIAEKVLGHAGAVLGPVASSTLTGLGAAAVDPRVAAYERGVKNAATLGFDEVGIKSAMDAPAGHAYGERVTAPGEVHGGYETAGSVVGMTALALGGSGLGGARALATPGSMVTGAGALAEGLTGRALGGLAARGALGRAAATGAKLAVRGAVESALVGGANEYVKDTLTDTPATGTKIFLAMGHSALGGAVVGGSLGFGGSLAASGVRGVGAIGRSALAKAASSARGAGEAVEEGLVEVGERTANRGQKLGLGDIFTKPNEAGRAIAQDQAWSAVGAGFGLQSTKYAKQAATYFPNGTRDLGEVALRYGIIDVPHHASPFAAAMQAARSGSVVDMVPKLETAVDTVGQKIGTITEQSGARVPAPKLVQALDDVAAKYESAAASRPVGRSIRNFGADLLDSLGVQDLNGSTAVQDLLRERKALDRLVFRDAPTIDPKLALEAKRAIRSKLEDLITGAMDDASGRVKGELAGEYKALKKDYHALRILQDAAEDSAARASKAGGLGLKDLAMGAMGGGFGTGTALALGSKLARERGNAVVAAFVTRAVDTGQLAKIVQSVDAKISGSAKRLMTEASEVAPKSAPKESPVARAERGRAEHVEMQTQAQELVKWAGDIRANPARVVEQLKDAAEMVGRAAGPNASSAYTAAAVRALNYVVSYIPVRERRDPLDPRSIPPMTLEEAQRAVRAAGYAKHPLSVFDDFSRGIVTPEGLRAAELFAPEEMMKFRAELLDHATDHMMRNRQLTQSRRLLLDKLGIPAIRPDSIVSLQANLMAPAPAGAPPAKPAPQKSPGMMVQQSGYDAIEARLSTG
jgi:hypothetical protein